MRAREREGEKENVRAKKSEKERECSSLATGARVYASRLLSLVKVPSKTPCADLDAEVQTPGPESVSSKDARKEASGRLAASPAHGVRQLPFARSGYLRAYVDCRHVCQNKKYIYGTDGMARCCKRGTAKNLRSCDDDY